MFFKRFIITYFQLLIHKLLSQNSLGNCCFKKDDIEKAKEIYMVALENDASCVEALYNLRYNQGNQENTVEDKNTLLTLI